MAGELHVNALGHSKGKRLSERGRPLLEESLHFNRRRKPAGDAVPDRSGALENEREIGGRPHAGSARSTSPAETPVLYKTEPGRHR